MSLALASLGVVPLAVGSRVRVRRAAAARRTRTLNIGGSDPARVSFHGRVRATNRGRLDGRSPAARLGPLATSEDGPEREVATSDRSSPSDHMDDVPKVKFNNDDAGQPARSPAVRLASRLLAAVAFASAGLAVPFIAHAAKSASTPASAAVTASHGPNLIHMSDETRGKLDAVFLSGFTALETSSRASTHTSTTLGTSRTSGSSSSGTISSRTVARCTSSRTHVSLERPTPTAPGNRPFGVGPCIPCASSARSGFPCTSLTTPFASGRCFI